MPLYPDIKENFSLHQFNTFHLESIAKYFTEVNSIDQLVDLVASGKLNQNPLLLLGGGSNLLFTGNFKGIAVHIINKGIEIIHRTEENVVVKASAGENWHDFVTYCVKDLQTGELKYFNRKDCQFGYRDSIFKRELKGKVAIWSVTFELKLNPVVHLEYGAIKQELASMQIEKPGIADVSNAVCNIRRSKLPDPDLLGNSGSFFKNPTVDQERAEKLLDAFPKMVSYPFADGLVKIAAGWMIEQCGWKGFREGDAGVHQSQALVLVNYGNATGRNILTLAHRIQNSVYERFGVQLEMEVNVI